MKLIDLLSPLLGITGWVLAGLAANHMLSGNLAERTCRTECMQALFFSALAIGVAALVLGLMSVHKSRNWIPGSLALMLALPLCGVLGGIVVIGVLAS